MVLLQSDLRADLELVELDQVAVTAEGGQQAALFRPEVGAPPRGGGGGGGGGGARGGGG